MKIPRIIHQIWSGIDEPLPKYFSVLGETWKNNHPAWEYMFWDEARINGFIQEYYPQYQTVYKDFKYNVQRWDVIRYLILEKIGGVYADFDYECISPLDELLNDKSCCFACEPSEYVKFFSKEVYFNNALMASIPNHPFMKVIIEAVFKETYKEKVYPSKMIEVLETTGPLIITSLYEQYDAKESIYLIPEELVSPFSKNDVRMLMNKTIEKETEEYLEKKLEHAIAIHYFWGSWL